MSNFKESLTEKNTWATIVDFLKYSQLHWQAGIDWSPNWSAYLWRVSDLESTEAVESISIKTTQYKKCITVLFWGIILCRCKHDSWTLTFDSLRCQWNHIICGFFKQHHAVGRCKPKRLFLPPLLLSQLCWGLECWWQGCTASLIVRHWWQGCTASTLIMVQVAHDVVCPGGWTYTLVSALPPTMPPWVPSEAGTLVGIMGSITWLLKATYLSFVSAKLKAKPSLTQALWVKHCTVSVHTSFAVPNWDWYRLPRLLLALHSLY